MFPWSAEKDKRQRAAKKLRIASEEGDAAKVRALLKKGNVDVNTPDDDGWTALHEASIRRNIAVVDVLLKANADPNATNKSGLTALYWALVRHHVRHHVPVVKLLLKANADPNAPDKNGLAPLHHTSSKGQSQLVELLLEANANPNVAAKDGKTPLHFACSRPQSDTVAALLEGGADIHLKDNQGQKPLHSCLEPHRVLPFSNETLDALQVLVSYGATWDATCDDMVASRKAWELAPALRLCILLWSEEHADGVDFSDIPMEVIERGVDSTQAFIGALKTSLHLVLRRKICLVGSSCAGKTSFVKSITSELLQPQLEHVDDRTIGIDHFPLRFEQPVASRDGTKVHEVTFWDFAGQDAYQVAHSLFFSPRTLFLVFVDLEAFTTAFLQASIMAHVKKQEAQLMDEFIEHKVMHWIRLILARQPDAEFVFIATKEDLLKENQATERLLKEGLLAKLKEVDTTVREMKKKKLETEEITELKTSKSSTWVEENANSPNVLFTSSTSSDSVRAARNQVQELIIESERSFVMPDIYSQALEVIKEIRESAKGQNVTTQIKRVFAPVDSLPAALQIEPELCRTILQTLHDLGDVLWYVDLDVGLFRDTVILDPLLLIDFIRQVVNHQHAGVTMPHVDLKSLPYWVGLSDKAQMKAIKQVLQKFHLVYPDDEAGEMEWFSDLIVPAFWQTKTPAAWLFLGDILRINKTMSKEGEAVRVDWEYHFEYGLPSSLFDHLVVASVSPHYKFDAGPDWILYEENGVAACRIMVGRDVKSLHRTIHVEAVVAVTADKRQVDRLWRTFKQLCGAFILVLSGYPGLAVSSFAWNDAQKKINMQRLVQWPAPNASAKWMPPAATWEWYRQLASRITNSLRAHPKGRRRVRR